MPLMPHSSQRIFKRTHAPSAFLMLLSLSLSVLSPQTAIAAPEPPSKQFIRRNIPIGWILNEWYDKSGQQIPLYVCVCTRSTCDVSQRWPFRQFSVGETIPALGPTNQNDAQQLGFTCGQVEPKDLPLRGIGG